MLVVNSQEDGYQAIEMCEIFYDTVPDDPDEGGYDDNVDYSGNMNDIDSGNDGMHADGSEGDVAGDTDDVDAAEANDVAIYHTAYTNGAVNYDVGSNTKNNDATEADNADADDNTKYGNNVGMDEVPMPLMMLKLIIMILDINPNMV